MKFNKMIPELTVTDLEVSKNFYLEDLGFKVEYERTEDQFTFLSRGEVQLMLEQKNGHWETGELYLPFGRGINFQIEIKDPESLAGALESKGIKLFKSLSRNIYITPNGKEEQIEFLVQDPDGYLLRFCN